MGDEPGEMGANLPAMDLGDFVPVRLELAYATACPIDGAGKVKCWGHNLRGTCLTSNTAPSDVIGDSASEMGNQLPVLDVGTGRSVVGVSAHQVRRGSPFVQGGEESPHCFST